MSERFQASVLRGHQTALTEFVGRLQAGVVVVPTAQELADLGNLAGALNYWAAEPVITLPVSILPEFVDGAPRFVFGCTATEISAIPFNVKPGPYTATSMIVATAAEYQWGGTAFASAAINRVPGDMTGAQTANSSLMVVRDAATDGDGLWYYNIVLAPGSQPRGTGFSVTFPR